MGYRLPYAPGSPGSDGKESYWDGQEWIAVRDSQSGSVPTPKQGMSSRRIVMIVAAMAVFVAALAYGMAGTGVGCGSAMIPTGRTPCHLENRQILLVAFVSSAIVLFWLSNMVDLHRR